MLTAAKLDLLTLVALMARVVQSELHPAIGSAGWPDEAEGRSVAQLLYLRGVEPAGIAAALDLPAESVRAYTQRSKASRSQREIIRKHFAGATVAQIASDTGLSRTAVYDALQRAGVKPNRAQSPPPPGRRQRIVSLRQQGKSYAEIRQATGATTNQVRMALRDGAQKGLLPDYGAGVKPRS
ncbi:MAG: hypothetical protein M3P85_13860 [Actinomycetota bacterium]|nr:hypothetical protein [Actinomycetota bacterium]